MENKLRNYSFYMMMSELLWIFISLSTFFYFYSVLDVTKIDDLDSARFYDFLGYINVPESKINIFMSYSVLILVITVPLLVFNIKNFHNLKEGKYQRETGIYQIVAGSLSVIALNIPAAILYIISGRKIVKDKPKVKIEYKREEFGTQKEYYTKMIFSILSLTLLIFIALLIIVPFYWMLLTSLMSKSTFQGFTDMKFYLGFQEMVWINFKEALEKANFDTYIMNTLLVAFFTTTGTVITTILSAFAFSRLEFKGRDTLFSILLMTMMVPGELYVITNFVTISNTFNWYNTFYAMIVPFAVSIFYIFFLRQTFKQIPDSLYKAAKVDGCSDFKFLMRVMMPIATPTLITITILNALGTWNAYIWPRLVAEEDHYLVSIALRSSFVDVDTGIPDYRLQMAAAALITVPILIIFLFARKFIMRGVGRSGTKG